VSQFFEFLPRIAQADFDRRALRIAPVFVQPIAADEVAAALADIATSAPRNYMIEHGGPELFQLDEIVRRVMELNLDPREIITDPRARYFGASLQEDTLIPDEGAIMGVTRFDDWVAEALKAGFATGRRLPSTRYDTNGYREHEDPKRVA